MAKTQDPKENIFSDDEEETKFIAEVSRIKEDAWTSSDMKWNTIHGIAWARCDLLGRGTFGSVFLGMRWDKKLFAVKSINVEYPPTPKSKFTIKCQIVEIKMMRIMRSKYIVRCLGCGRSNGDNGLRGEETLDVFLEYVARGSLKHVIKARKKPFEETPYVRQYTYDLLKALQYMTKHGVVHGDIKSSNLLLADDCVKLADWGGAKQLTTNNLTKILTGTFGFRSPEVLKEEEQGHPSDIFSLGCTIIEMMDGRSPKEVAMNANNLTHFSQEPADYRPQIPKHASPECKDFLEQCLHPSAEDRWTAAELLNHPFITNRDKTSTLPYSMAVPQRIEYSLLQPPRRIDPELPDEPMTRRVYKHLTGVQQSWVPNLLGCRPQLPSSPPSSFRMASPPRHSADPLPLPPFSADVVINEDTNLHTEIVQALCEEGGAVVKKIYPPLAPPPAKGAIKGHAGSKFKDADDKSLHVHFNPNVRVKEYKDSIILSASLMEALNDDIYTEAKRAVWQTFLEDDEGPPDPSRSLFPNDPSIARSGSGRPFLTQSAETQIGCSMLDRSRGRGFDICAGDKAVDVLTPGTKPAPKEKKAKKYMSSLCLELFAFVLCLHGALSSLPLNYVFVVP